MKRLSITVGDHTLAATQVADAVGSYCRAHHSTVLYYDFDGDPDGDVRPSDGFTLTDIGRVSLINPDLSGDDVATVLDVIATNVDWTLVPGDARLEDADPSESDGLYDRMERMWSQVRRPRIKDAKSSKLLHLKRPFAFPILDLQVRSIYSNKATELGRKALLPGRGRARVLPQFWLAVRHDLLQSATAFDEVRNQLETRDDADVRRGAKLPNLRYVDIVAWSLGRPRRRAVSSRRSVPR